MRRTVNLLLGLVVGMSLALTFAPVAPAYASSIATYSEASSFENTVKSNVLEERTTESYNYSLNTNTSVGSVQLSAHGKSEPRNLETANQILVAQPAFAPVIAWVLRLVIQRGIPYAIKIAGRTALQKAFRQNLMAQNSNKWNHIFQARNQWGKVGAQGNRSKAADLLAKAASKGRLYKNDKLVREY